MRHRVIAWTEQIVAALLVGIVVLAATHADWLHAVVLLVPAMLLTELGRRERRQRA